MIDAAFLKPNDDKIPELLLLGQLETMEIPEADGEIYLVQYIMYEGIKYVMKAEVVGRWFDERPPHAPKSMFDAPRKRHDLFDGLKARQVKFI